MNLRRLLRHLFTSPWAVRKRFPAPVLESLDSAIAATERRHGGELRWAIEGSLDGAALWNDITPRDRAMDVFSSLRMWDTAANNGVLIYVLLADHAVEIIADRGFTDSSGEPDWQAVCRTIERAFAGGDYRGGVLEGTALVGELIAARFPAGDRDELPNSAVLL
jgi:uncharacterized membrane protein